jgi:hypothetical protein
MTELTPKYVAAAAHISAIDPKQIHARHLLAEYAGNQLTAAGDELDAIGVHSGNDQQQLGESPFGNGSDEIVAVATLLRICGQLTTSAELLFRSNHAYAAAALIRQMVEIEYLAWAFQTRDSDAQAWLRSTKEQREKFFAPRILRAAAEGRFRTKDYGHHCELGGHPTPLSGALLQGSQSFSAQLLLSDMLGHVGRIWDNIGGWSENNAWATPIHARRLQMYERFSAWKKIDWLTTLPPAP